MTYLKIEEGIVFSDQRLKFIVFAFIAFTNNRRKFVWNMSIVPEILI